MSERRFYICEEGIFKKWITEAELKRRLSLIVEKYTVSSLSWTHLISILLHGTEKNEPAIPELPADCEPPEVLKPHKQATEQEWEKWAESMPSAPGEPWEWSNKMRNWALAIPCHKRREG